MSCQVGYEKDYLQRQPHIILLETAFYHREMKPVLANWMLIFLQGKQLGKRTNVPLDAFRPYLEGVADAEEALVGKLTEEEWKILNLSNEWLNKFMPHCLRKVNRVSFGLMNEAEVRAALKADPMLSSSRVLLAVPFVGKDAPSAAAEFAQPDIIIGLTILAYQRQKLRESDMVDLIGRLQEDMDSESGTKQQRKTSVKFSRWSASPSPTPQEPSHSLLPTHTHPCPFSHPHAPSCPPPPPPPPPLSLASSRHTQGQGG